jgi:hypothetical protein
MKVEKDLGQRGPSPLRVVSQQFCHPLPVPFFLLAGLPQICLALPTPLRITIVDCSKVLRCGCSHNTRTASCNFASNIQHARLPERVDTAPLFPSCHSSQIRPHRPTSAQQERAMHTELRQQKYAGGRHGNTGWQQGGWADC